MEKDLKNLIAENIRYWRKRFGISQIELAKKIDVTSQYISLIETGKRTPTLNFLSKISGVLDVPVYTFLMNREQADNIDEYDYRMLVAEDRVQRAERYGSIAKVVELEKMRKNLIKKILESKTLGDMQDIDRKINSAVDKLDAEYDS